MSKELKFRFYAVVKDEDAFPYLSDNLLVAADGLGGSGSSVHHIDRKKFSDMKRELEKSAFDGFEGEAYEALKPYIEELIASLLDDTDDTSALWASRIVIARFLYALMRDDRYSPEKLAKDEVRTELSRYIKEGLTKTAKHFDLKIGNIRGLSLLPSTLAALRVAESEDALDVEAIWAGDSRLYALTPDGMKALSRDDEDASGAITNLFSADREKTKINYRTYRIPKPCVLMAVSDGIFDPFSPTDHLGVESTFLSAMQKSESIEAMRDSLLALFQEIRADDATVAFKAYGYESYKQLRAAFAARAAYVEEMFGKSHSLKDAMEVLSTDGRDMRDYVAQRTLDKMKTVKSLLLATAEEGKDDIVLQSAALANAVSALQKTAEEERLKAYKLHYKAAMDVAVKHFVEHPDMLVAALANKGLTAQEKQRVIQLSAACKKVIDTQSKLQKSYAALAQLERDQAELRAQVIKKIRDLDSCDAEIRATLATQNAKERAHSKQLCTDLMRRRIFWMQEDFFFDFGGKQEKVAGMAPDERKLFDSIHKLRQKQLLKKQDNREANSIFESAKKAYEKLLNQFFAFILNKQNVDKVLTPKAVKELGLADLKPQSDAAEGAVSDALKKFLSTASDSDLAGMIVDALAENYDKSSVIDSCYNATRLFNFRLYYRIPKDEVIAFSAKLKKLMESYEA